jgi:tetratricopeptide (TPR) repeat protein
MPNEPGFLMTKGNIGSALQQAAFALNSQRPGEAERIAAGVLKADPRDARALHILGCALLMQGRAAEAIAPLEAAARSRHDPEIDMQLAAALRQAGRVDDALSRLRRAIKRQPPYPKAFHELGCALASTKHFDEAADVFSRGRDIAPMVAEFSIQLGRVFLERRDFANAKHAFARALEISPASHDALFGMALAHRGAGEYDKAAEHFRRCLATKPEPGTWLNLGRCLLHLGQFDEGYECFRFAVRSDPKRYGSALGMLAKSARGRFWLKPSAAAQFLQGK